MNCIRCGAALLEKDKFCPECGSPVVEITCCPECGVKMRPRQIFCTNCGMKVNRTMKNPESVPPFEASGQTSSEAKNQSPFTGGNFFKRNGKGVGFDKTIDSIKKAFSK